MASRILFVDDEPNVLEAIERALHAQRHVWEMVFMDDPEAAWKQLLATPFDAVICDIRMPRLSGLQLLDRIAATPQTQHIPVVMLTGINDRSLKRQALDRGAVDLLNKPAETEDLLARLRAVLRLKTYDDQLRAHNQLLEQRVAERTEELYHSRLDMIWRLGKAAEHRDENSGHHVIRVGCISRVVAAALGLLRTEVEMIFVAAPLHDIGKIGIADAILKKRGPLSPGERAAMQQHCLIGARILREDSLLRETFCHWRGLSAVETRQHLRNPLLDMAATVAMAHHERWDGSGYPRGLGGEAIPLPARIVAIADVFDALTSERPYKSPFPVEEALRIVTEGAGSHFDPRVYEAFMDERPAIDAVRRTFADQGAGSRSVEEEIDETDLVCR